MTHYAAPSGELYVMLPPTAATTDPSHQMLHPHLSYDLLTGTPQGSMFVPTAPQSYIHLPQMTLSSPQTVGYQQQQQQQQFVSLQTQPLCIRSLSSGGGSQGIASPQPMQLIVDGGGQHRLFLPAHQHQTQQQQQQQHFQQLPAAANKLLAFHQAQHQQAQQRTILRAKRRNEAGAELMSAAVSTLPKSPIITHKEAVTSSSSNGGAVQSLLGRPTAQDMLTSVSMLAGAKRPNESKPGADITAVQAAKRAAYYDVADHDAQHQRSGAYGWPPAAAMMMSSTAAMATRAPAAVATTVPLVVRVTRTMEFYFSDECLSKNAYLLKHIQQHKDGYISVRRVAGLKRIKTLTKDVALITESVRQSSKLELSADQTMMRRRDRRLPNNIEVQPAARKVIGINLPQELPTVETVASLFKPYGELTQVTVIKPGTDLPHGLSSFRSWVPDLGVKYCALVEFENQDDAQKACREINMRNREVNKFRVALLKNGARLRRTLYRVYKDENESGQSPTGAVQPNSGDAPSSSSSPSTSFVNG